MTLLQELKKMAETCDSEYEMLCWLELNKEELNKHGIWLHKTEEESRVEYLGK